MTCHSDDRLLGAVTIAMRRASACRALCLLSFPADFAAGAPMTAPEFSVESLVASHENRAPTLIEWGDRLQVEFPYFILNAEVRFRAPPGETWRIGFIQVCERLTNQVDFADGRMKWTLPHAPYRDGRPEVRAPWYNHPAIVHGTGSEWTAAVTMYDTLHQESEWRRPSSPGEADGPGTLRAIDRSQRFVAWLAAQRDSDGKLVLIRRITWSYQVRVDVDYSAHLGKRAHVSSFASPPPQVEFPRQDDEDLIARSGAQTGEPPLNQAQRFVDDVGPAAQGDR